MPRSLRELVGFAEVDAAVGGSAVENAAVGGLEAAGERVFFFGELVDEIAGVTPEREVAVLVGSRREGVLAGSSAGRLLLLVVVACASCCRGDGG